MAPMWWAPPVQGCATRRSPDVLDLRPLSVPQLALGARRPAEVPSGVRGNGCSGQRARSHGQAMQKRHREQLLEQQRYENALYPGHLARRARRTAPGAGERSSK